MRAVTSTILVALPLLVSGHGTITRPAMRDNPTTPGGGWCPWCQGTQDFCNPNATHKCAPPSPCWGASPGTTVPRERFGVWKDIRRSDGTTWIEIDGSEPTIPTWCPGDVITIHFFINADHNGVYRWESQLAFPGNETEEGFKNFTAWTSDNQEPDADYYAKDGITKLAAGRCIKPNTSNETWTPHFAHCRDNVFANTTLKLPDHMPAGATVLRWFWYGAMKTDGERVAGPEHSLFVNCKDVIIGSPSQCSHTRCPEGTLDACLKSCPEETGKWDGNFDKFIGNTDFCSDCGNFGRAKCSYVCAGGGASGGGGGCDPAACSSGQYSFHDDGWNVSLTEAIAGYKVPYRAFAYLPFCHGAKMNTCLQNSFDFSLWFRTMGGAGWGAYVKLLFWTDAGNILGLLPPGAPGAKGNKSYRLLVFPGDDYPNKWQADIVIEDNTWYGADISIKGTSVTVSVGGKQTSADLGIEFGADSNGPQLGVYSFDYGGTRTSDMAINIGAVKGPGSSAERYACRTNCLASCDKEPAPSPGPGPSPTPGPVPPSPSPPGTQQCCFGGSTCKTATACPKDEWCSASEGHCVGFCNGVLCPNSGEELLV